MNPVQFKVSPVGKDVMNEVKGMTVFNTEVHDVKKQPMFFGKPLGVQRYDSYKYPVFEKLTTQQLGYFWRPEEVSLQKDRGDYHSLRPEQKHIYTSNLKYQIMLDSIQGRGPGMAFIPYCGLPELEACMEVWGFMEMIHSILHIHHQERICSIHQRFLTRLSLTRRSWTEQRVLQSRMMTFINCAQTGVLVTCGQTTSEILHLLLVKSKMSRGKLYRAVANVNILEGIRFYVSFACSFAFGDLNSWKGRRRSFPSLPVTRINILRNHSEYPEQVESGDDPVMRQIAEGRTGVGLYYV